VCVCVEVGPPRVWVGGWVGGWVAEGQAWQTSEGGLGFKGLFYGFKFRVLNLCAGQHCAAQALPCCILPHCHARPT
jgi:hypothetical protein